MTAQIINISNDPEVARLHTQNGYIALLCTHESVLAERMATPSKIIMPERWERTRSNYACSHCGHTWEDWSKDEKPVCPQCQMNKGELTNQRNIAVKAGESTSGNHYGTVVAVDPDQPAVLKFGDSVLVSRWGHGHWYYGVPFGWQKFENPWDGGQAAAVEAHHRLAFVKVEDIIYRIQPMPHKLPGMPLTGRIIIRHDPREESIGSFSRAASQRPVAPCGTILAVGAGIDGLEVGQRVMVSRKARMSTWTWDGQEYSSVVVSAMIWDAQLEDVVEEGIEIIMGYGCLECGEPFEPYDEIVQLNPDRLNIDKLNCPACQFMALTRDLG